MQPIDERKMTDTTTENFWKAWIEPVDPPKPIFYRLYYDSQGHPVCYTMEDLPGTYIEIDQATYAQSSLNVRVVNDQVQIIKKGSMVSKLQPCEQGTSCDPRDVCVIIDKHHPHTNWNIVTHEIH